MRFYEQVILITPLIMPIVCKLLQQSANRLQSLRLLSTGASIFIKTSKPILHFFVYHSNFSYSGFYRSANCSLPPANKYFMRNRKSGVIKESERLNPASNKVFKDPNTR